MKCTPWLHKVQYYETDQMAIVHHSNYIRWFEEARTDWFDQMEMPVTEVEGRGVMIPVVSCAAQYRVSALLRQVVEIRVFKLSYNGIRLKLRYEVRNHDTCELMVTGETEHCFTLNGQILNLRHRFPDLHEILTHAEG